jgi:hypothetical protein
VQGSATQGHVARAVRSAASGDQKGN